jgi:hypothetical protein
VAILPGAMGRAEGFEGVVQHLGERSPGHD